MKKRSKKDRSGKDSCGLLFLEFFRIGLFTIGGGMAMIPQIQQVVVDDRKWLSEEEMVDCIAVSQSMPGVIAINSATYIGNRLKGAKGAMAATAGVILPSFLIIMILVTVLGSMGDNRYVDGAFTGIKAAVCALILFSAGKMAKQILDSPFQWVIAAASIAAVIVFGVTAVWIVVAAAVLGVIHNVVKTGHEERKR